MGDLIQEKADTFLKESGLMDILQKYGKVTIVGSYKMKVMSWNDLDFYIDIDSFDYKKYHDMAIEIISIFHPVRFDGIQDVEKKQLFLGFEIDSAGERWNIDIWWKEKVEIENAIEFAGILMQQMEQKPELRVAVMSIKQELISKKLYGLDKAKMHYHSKEIYDAVFNRGILSAEQFMMTHAPNN